MVNKQLFFEYDFIRLHLDVGVHVLICSLLEPLWTVCWPPSLTCLFGDIQFHQLTKLFDNWRQWSIQIVTDMMTKPKSCHIKHKFEDSQISNREHMISSLRAGFLIRFSNYDLLKKILQLHICWTYRCFIAYT